MNYDKIDIKLTLKHKKIIARKHWFNWIMDTLIYNTLFLVYPFSVVFYIYTKIQNSEDVPYLAIANLIISIIIAFGFFYALKRTTRFERIKGLQINENRTMVEKLVARHKWKERRKSKTLLIVSPHWDYLSFNWGRQFNFLFDKNDIYINVVSFGRFDLVSPFHYFADRHKEKQIIQELTEMFNVQN